jgi:hypothetical protein
MFIRLTRMRHAGSVRSLLTAGQPVASHRE